MTLRIRPLLLGLTLLPFLGAAQPTHLITSARSVDSANNRKPTAAQTIATEKVATTETVATTVEVKKPAHCLPLFGERSKSIEQIEQEIRFLNDCDQNFSNRQEASQFFAARGWDYIADGQLDTAAYRFNLSYLLNDKNADAFWGLGVICYQQEKLPDAIRMLKKGLAVVDTNTVLMTDLATVQIKYYQHTKDENLLNEAETYLYQALAVDAANATAHIELSYLYFTRANYPKAWESLHKARALDLSVIDLAYLGELLAKMPDPKGFFK